MAQHPIDEKNVSLNFSARLQKLAKLWYRMNEAPFKHQQQMLRLWESGYFNERNDREHLINLIDRGVGTIVPFLVEGDPKVDVETLVSNYKSWAFTTKLALNFFINQMELADNVLIPAAINSMFGAGITRTFTEYDRKVTLDDETIKAGRPTVKVIHDTDYVGDAIARDREDFAFEGDIYRLPTEYAKDLFAGKDSHGKEIADYIQSDCRLISDYSPKKISDPGFNRNKWNLRDQTTFIDIYLFDENRTVTIMPEGNIAKILRSVEEDGPKESPYDYLGYKYFPGHPVPIPPAWFWHDADVSMNIVAKTARQQAESQKDLILVDAPGKKLGEQITNAKNLDVLQVPGLDGVKPISVGGMNAENLGWMSFAEDVFNKSGGTEPIMRGAGTNSPTLGQDQMLQQNASRIVNNMYTRYHRFMTSILKKLAYRIWTDPTVFIPLVHDVPGVGSLPKIFSQPDKVGQFYDFVFSIVPYSTQRMSPETKYSRMMQYASQWILPTMPLAAQQGAEFDIPEATQRMAGYLGFDDFNQLYRTAVPKQTDMVPYTMQPSGQKRPEKSPGQGNDSFGALSGSREANSQSKQGRLAMELIGTDKAVK
ncbi:MAG: hypothetical protein GY938_30835 [Ketobacter sp.]|nr:hypothetical protein [Ketobacter sp.]